MNDGSEQQAGEAQKGLPPWAQCELFCIEDYAGTGAAACGWRGRIHDAHRDTKMRFVCPKCGHATLLRIPPERAE
jgi:predicted RNA-binding Zn-ribbon protein involved in translation (DUF1610 family)